MVKIELEQELPFGQDKVWAVISDVTRSDWVPSVEKITMADDVRCFTM